MHFEQLEQITGHYHHVYLSPHLDDAALSCGGAILAQRAADERVLVVTLCTAAPDPQGPFSSLAQDFHRHWALEPAEVVSARLREEQLAMERMGADSYWAGLLDAIYRYPEAYDSRDSLFGVPSEHDPLLSQVRDLLTELRARLPEATFYAPLGIGHHVDHQITYRAAREVIGHAIAFYEDFPYVARPGALDRRMAAINGALRSRTIPIDRVIDGKIAAIHAYSSQLVELFGSSEAMERSVTGYARGIGSDATHYGERLWLPA